MIGGGSGPDRRLHARGHGEALAALPDGLTELYTHPATADVWPGSAPGYRYRDELAALVAPATRAALAASGALAAPFAHWPPPPDAESRR
jgi:hypothetical protein